jgi:hypothetical protein
LRVFAKVLLVGNDTFNHSGRRGRFANRIGDATPLPVSTAPAAPEHELISPRKIDAKPSFGNRGNRDPLSAGV